MAGLGTRVYHLAFVDAMRPTLLVAVGLLVAAALLCLVVRGRGQNARAHVGKAA